jgi:LytTr DNA-binding domain
MLKLTSRSAPLLQWQALASLPVAGAAIGLAGPFASYGEMDTGSRVAHFMLCVTAIGSAALVVSYRVARRFFQGYWPLWAALLVDLALVVPGAALVYASLSLFAPDVLDQLNPAHLLWQNLLIALAFRDFSLFASWRRIRDGDDATGQPVPIQPPDEFRQRLPFALRSATILALSAEDHYLRVHTPGGEALIHMTLAAAVQMLPAGFQIHRSHWVAREGVKSFSNGKVELHTGLKLPVSRHRSKDFAAWINAPVHPPGLQVRPPGHQTQPASV